MFNETELIKIAIKAAIAAGNEILKVYSKDFEVEFKQDNSPLTLADQKAHNIIVNKLEKTGFPILSEEGKDIPYDIRKNWQKFWMVDPLDGTKEFVKRNGEFTVNIALIDNGKAEAGVIFVPVTGVMYFACNHYGAKKITVTDPLNMEINLLLENAIQLPFHNNPWKFTVVCSRSHMSQETKDYIDQLNIEGREMDFVSIGSSLKMCLVAEGSANIYPRFGPTMEWDTAAGQAIVEKSGGKVVVSDGHSPLLYNKPELLNPWFIVSRET